MEFDSETRKSIPLSEVEVTNERVEIKGDNGEEAKSADKDKNDAEG